jgi:PBP1b-binding outer membrane lipoprotein LpoB
VNQTSCSTLTFKGNTQMKQSLIVAALLAVALSACGKKEEAPVEASAPAVEASAPAVEASAPAADASAPAADASAPAASAAQ